MQDGLTFIKTSNVDKADITFIKTHLLASKEELNYGEIIGKEILGPLLYSFVNWLHEWIKRDDIKELWFLSREGKLLLTVYNLLFPDDNIKCEYILVSRKALLLPSLYLNIENLDVILKLITELGDDKKLRLIGEDLLAGENYLRDICVKGLNPDDSLSQLSEKEKKVFFLLIKPHIEEEGGRQYNLLKEYFESKLCSGRIGIVDIGWKGTMQKRIIDCLNLDAKDVYGYYVAVIQKRHKNYYSDIIMRGYLNAFDRQIGVKVRCSAALLETLFQDTDGSVAYYYKDSKGDISIRRFKSEYNSESEKFILEAQGAALNIVSKLRDSGNIDREDATKIFLGGFDKLAIHPASVSVKALSNICYMRGDVKFFLPQKRWYEYFGHIGELLNEFKGSSSKVIYLKALLRMPFPYYRFLWVLNILKGNN